MRVVAPDIVGRCVVQVRNKVGERLYVAISATHPTMAPKLTGMFLEATEVCMYVCVFMCVCMCVCVCVCVYVCVYVCV